MSRSRRLLTHAASLAMLCTLGFAVSFAQSQEPLTITLAGQSMIRSDVRATAPAAVPVIQSLLKGDVVFTNFEAAVAEKGESTHEGRGFLTPPESLDALTTFGFNLFSLSDNHSFDFKAKGIQNTLAEVKSRNLVHAGIGLNLDEASAPAYLKTAKGTVALVSSASGLIVAGGNATATTPGVNELRVAAGGKPNEASADLPGPLADNVPNADDAQRILASIREARQHADIVIAYQHNHIFSNHAFSTVFTEGLQERLAPNPWLVKWVHQEIDAGADIVVMHGAPLLHGVEIYKGKPIIYDLGSFIYNTPPTLTYIDEPIAWEGAVATLQYKGKQLESISFKPILLNNIGQGDPAVHDEYANNQFLDTRGLPTPASGARAGYILERLVNASKPFGTAFEMDGDTAVVKLKK